MDTTFFSEWERYEGITFKVLYSRSSPTTEEDTAMPVEMNWIAMVDRLANGDITKHEEIYKLNYIECLNLLMYWYYRDLEIESKNRIRNTLANQRH